jgi:hypothetical protein
MHISKAKLPLDLQYMITPWAEDTELQLRMLGWVMRMLEDQSTLSASHLNHYIGETDTFSAIESVDIICDPAGAGRLFHDLESAAYAAALGDLCAA